MYNCNFDLQEVINFGAGERKEVNGEDRYNSHLIHGNYVLQIVSQQANHGILNDMAGS